MLAEAEERTANELSPDERYFVDHKDELLQAYQGRFVAIRYGEVLADAPTRRELEDVLIRRFGPPAYALVKRVTKDAFEVGRECPVFVR